jgi:hypothetical protein
VRGATKLEAFSNYLVDDGEAAAAGSAAEASVGEPESASPSGQNSSSGPVEVD